MHKIPKSEFERFVRRNLMRGIKWGYSPDEIIEVIAEITARGFEVSDEPDEDDPIQLPRPVAIPPAAKPTAAHASRRGWTEAAKPILAVTECSLEQSEDIAHTLEEALGIHAVPAVLQNFREHPRELIDSLGPRALYVTTPFHQTEMIKLLAQFDLEPYILDLTLSRAFLDVLKGLSRYKVVGVLCREDSALAAASGFVRAYLKKNDATQVLEALVDDAEAVARLAREAEIVIHAPNCRVDAEVKLPWGVRKVETTFDVDAGSLAGLRAIVERHPSKEHIAA